MGKFHINNIAELTDSHRKRQLTHKLFNLIASRYQLAIQILSFGRDQKWKKLLIQQLPKMTTPRCLDLACGTGDISFLLGKRYRRGQVIGFDLSENMLAKAQKRKRLPKPWFVRGDMTSLSITHNSIDIITGGYALRNAPNLDLLLKNIWQVLSPEGTAAFLDFSKPSNHKRAKQHAWLLTRWCRFWGLLLHANAETYGYIPKSLSVYPNHEELARKIKQQGFMDYQTTFLLYGMIAITTFKKPKQEFQR